MPGAEERTRVLLRHEIGRHANRRVRLAAQRHRGRLGHADHVGRINNLESKISPVRMRGQRRFERRRLTDKCDRDGKVACGGNSAIDHGGRRMITAHRVDCDADQLFLVDGAHLALPVVPAVRADAVRSLRLVALRAEAGRGGAQGIVGPALGGACL
jgi:hypothetical protein